jgi:glycosyltransferase involved in cell wall biosynthesis
MKVLFVQKMNGISGSELYMLQIIPELKKRGYDVEMLIIYPQTGDKNQRFISFLADVGVKTHEIYNHFDFSPLLIRRIIGLLKRGQYDIVQANLVHADMWMSVIKAFFYRKLNVVSVKHGYHPAYQAKYGFDFSHLRKDPFYWIEKFVCRVVNFNITISRGLYSVYVDGGITAKSRIRNIYYGLTLTKPVEDHTVNVPAGPYVLITGRLVSFKGHKFLIEAWKKVITVHPDLTLCIAGEGKCRSELEKMVKDAGLQSRITFLGHVPNPHPLMQNCAFTVVSSTWEGFGLILLESWLHKKPIVAFDVPAMNEVVKDGVNGLLAKAQDSEDLAEKIISLYSSKENIKNFGEQGYRDLHSFYTLKRMTDETEEIYKAVYENIAIPLAEQRP